MDKEFEKRSQSAIKGWITRRAKQKAKKATEKALKGWDTRRENQAKEEARAEKASQTAKKGWETRRENQEKANKKVKKTKKNSAWFNIFVSILAFIIGFAGVIVGFCYYTKPANDVYVSGNLSFHFLELGNKYTGDCTYIKAGDIDILIDAGSRESSAPTIANYVNQFMTDNKFEFVIVTHADEDHIAAFADTGTNGGGIFSRYKIDTLIDFPQSNKTTQIYQKYKTKRAEEIAQGTVHYTALQCYNNTDGAQRIYNLGNSITMEIMYNYYYDHNDYSSSDPNKITTDENDYSVCLMFHQGDRNFLFTGDLEEKGENYFVNYYATNHGGLPKCELFKGGHHGSKTSSNDILLNAIQPKIVCVCCCAGSNQYDALPENTFPTQAFINRVAKHTKEVYVTTLDPEIQSVNPTWTMNGNIVVTSGKEVTVNCSNNNKLLKDTEWFKANRTMPAAWLSSE